MTETPSLPESTQCLIVGGGPAGAILGLLMAKAGVSTVLLEKHHDFDREFRGDTLHPSTLEVMDQLGLAERLLEIPHAKLEHARLFTANDQIEVADFTRLRTRFPYIAIMPQEKFLEFVTAEAAKQENFRLLLGADARRLLWEGDTVTGVRFRYGGAEYSLNASLTVAADGRHSRMRKESGLTLDATGPPMDVLWLGLPREPQDADLDVSLRIRPGKMLVLLERDEWWQLGYVILKGSFRELKQHGVEVLQSSIAEMAPELADRAKLLTDWKQVMPLSVESSRLRQWHKPGLLLIGDAAHVMSPVGGVGINYAIQDAVATANLLSGKLKRGMLTEADLKFVQKRREFPTKVIQRFQRIVQDRIIRQALNPEKPFKLPWFLKLPLIRRIPAWLIGFGVRRERVKQSP